MKILITGANGFLATNIRKKLSKYNFQCITKKDFNLLDSKSVNEFFKDKYFDVVLHCAILGGNRLIEETKDIVFDNAFGKNALTQCISHLPDTNFWHYSLQLNTYKKILEDKYGLKISDMYLICIHPDNPYKRYERIKVALLDKEIEQLFELRRKEVSVAAAM